MELYMEKMVTAKELRQYVGYSRAHIARLEAQGTVEDILLSPVLYRVLNTTATFPFEGTLLVRLNRAELGDLDCYILGNLIISQWKGNVVLPDFGFYQSPSHNALIRQNRLFAQVRSLDEVKTLKSDVLLMEPKIASRCTPDDAKVLAVYRGLVPGTNEYNDFIYSSIGG